MSYVTTGLLLASNGVSDPIEVSLESPESLRLRTLQESHSSSGGLFSQLQARADAQALSKASQFKATFSGVRPLDDEDATHLGNVEAARASRDEKKRREEEEDFARFRGDRQERVLKVVKGEEETEGGGEGGHEGMAEARTAGGDEANVGVGEADLDSATGAGAGAGGGRHRVSEWWAWVGRARGGRRVGGERGGGARGGEERRRGGAPRPMPRKAAARARGKHGAAANAPGRWRGATRSTGGGAPPHHLEERAGPV